MTSPMEPDSPYSPPAEGAGGLSLAELEGKKTFWKRTMWVSAALFVVPPLVGMIGTILGMRKAFSALGPDGIGDPNALAAAIGEALIATAVGLSLAVPVLVIFVISLIRFRSYRARLLKLSV